MFLWDGGCNPQSARITKPICCQKFQNKFPYNQKSSVLWVDGDAWNFPLQTHHCWGPITLWPRCKCSHCDDDSTNNHGVYRCRGGPCRHHHDHLGPLMRTRRMRTTCSCSDIRPRIQHRHERASAPDTRSDRHPLAEGLKHEKYH